MNVITREFDINNKQITLECKVSEPSTPLVPNPLLLDINAIIDTGCMVTSVSRKVINQLGITTPCGAPHGFNGAGGSGICTPYLIDLNLPNGISAKGIRVDCLDNMVPDMLIGMDILLQGDLCISTGGGKCMFSFQVPATHSTDYNAEIAKIQKMHIGYLKQGNNKCPCNSGKKWENCHGR